MRPRSRPSPPGEGAATTAPHGVGRQQDGGGYSASLLPQKPGPEKAKALEAHWRNTGPTPLSSAPAKLAEYLTAWLRGRVWCHSVRLNQGDFSHLNVSC